MKPAPSGMRDLTTASGARVAMMGLNLAAQSALAWTLGPADRGSYAVCMVFATVLGLIFLLGTDVGLQYFVASRRQSLSQAMVNAAICGLIGSTVAIVAGLIALRLPIAFFDKAPTPSFQLALVDIPLAMFANQLILLFTATRTFHWYAAFSVLSGLVHLVFVGSFVWLLGWGLDGAILAEIGKNLVVLVLALAVFRTRLGLHWVLPDLRQLREMFAFGLRYYGAKVSNMVNFQIGTVLVAFFATESEIGLFAVASALLARVYELPDILVKVLLPRVAEDKTGRPELVAQCARVVAMICFGVLGMTALLAPWIMTVLFSPAFAPAAVLVQIIAAGALVRSIGKIFVPYLIGTDHPGMASWAVATGVAVNLGAMLLLMPLIGLVGAAVAVTASYLISTIILQVAFIRCSGMGFARVWRFQRSDWSVMAGIWRRLRRRPAQPVVEASTTSAASEDGR